MGGGEKPELIINGKRLDGRALDEMRPLKIEVGAVSYLLEH